MVDITQCEVCGHTIPATEHGCAYCDRSRPPEPIDDDYLPLALRLLLGLFGVHLVFAATLAVLTLGHAGSWGTRGLAAARFALAASAFVAVLQPRPWGRWIPLTFVLVEGALVLPIVLGWVESWRGGFLPSLWGVLFFFLFLRRDVQARFDPRIRDRAAVDDLIRGVAGGPRR